MNKDYNSHRVWMLANRFHIIRLLDYSSEVDKLELKDTQKFLQQNIQRYEHLLDGELFRTKENEQQGE